MKIGIHPTGAPRARPDLRRERTPQAARVTNVELFLDLVFVYAITQISHTLIAHPDLMTLMQTVVIFLATWWLWMFTSWVTNWLNPERVPVRLAIFATMAAALLLSISIPDAFGVRGWMFALPYVAAQLGRSLFTLWSLGKYDPVNARNFQRIVIWFAITGPLWLTGAWFEDPRMRLILWGAAIALEYGSAAVGFVLPRLGRSLTSDWAIAGGHLAERCLLFVIIALGESLVMTAAPLAHDTSGAGAWAGFGSAFAGTVAMWWIYFNKGVEYGAHRIEQESDPGRLARLAYTYLHVPIVAGIIGSAVADELVISHPGEHVDTVGAAFILGGAFLFLAGMTAFKTVLYRRPPLSHLVGCTVIALMGAGIAMGIGCTRLALGSTVTLLLMVVGIWEDRSLREAP